MARIEGSQILYGIQEPRLTSLNFIARPMALCPKRLARPNDDAGSQVLAIAFYLLVTSQVASAPAFWRAPNDVCNQIRRRKTGLGHEKTS